jgi:hypothetical protein
MWLRCREPTVARRHPTRAAILLDSRAVVDGATFDIVADRCILGNGNVLTQNGRADFGAAPHVTFVKDN